MFERTKDTKKGWQVDRQVSVDTELFQWQSSNIILFNSAECLNKVITLNTFPFIGYFRVYYSIKM